MRTILLQSWHPRRVDCHRGRTSPGTRRRRRPATARRPPATSRSYSVALVYIGLGDFARAIEWSDRALRNPSPAIEERASLRSDSTPPEVCVAHTTDEPGVENGLVSGHSHRCMQGRPRRTMTCPTSRLERDAHAEADVATGGCAGDAHEVLQRIRQRAVERAVRIQP